MEELLPPCAGKVLYKVYRGRGVMEAALVEAALVFARDAEEGDEEAPGAHAPAPPEETSAALAPEMHALERNRGRL